jgi:hypothetical protein
MRRKSLKVTFAALAVTAAAITSSATATTASAAPRHYKQIFTMASDCQAKGWSLVDYSGFIGFTCTPYGTSLWALDAWTAG